MTVIPSTECRIEHSDLSLSSMANVTSYDGTPQEDAKVLTVLFKSYDLIAAVVKGIAEPTMMADEEHAAGLRDLHRAARFAYDYLGEDTLLRMKILAGLDETPTIPAIFWSNPDAYIQCATNLAYFCDRTPDTHEFDKLVAKIFKDTAKFREHLRGHGAFVGWVALNFMADFKVDMKKYEAYCLKFNYLGDTAAYQHDMWGAEPLRYVESEAGAELQYDTGYDADIEDNGDNSFDWDAIIEDGEWFTLDGGAFIDYVPDGENGWKEVIKPAGAPLGPEVSALPPTTFPAHARQAWGRKESDYRLSTSAPN